MKVMGICSLLVKNQQRQSMRDKWLMGGFTGVHQKKKMIKEKHFTKQQIQ
jgi:hypothetical protein